MVLHLLPLCSHIVKFVFVFWFKDWVWVLLSLLSIWWTAAQGRKTVPRRTPVYAVAMAGPPRFWGPDPVFSPGVAEGSQKLKQFLSSAPNYKSRSFVPILTMPTLLKEFQIPFFPKLVFLKLGYMQKPFKRKESSSFMSIGKLLLFIILHKYVQAVSFILNICK